MVKPKRIERTTAPTWTLFRCLIALALVCAINIIFMQYNIGEWASPGRLKNTVLHFTSTTSGHFLPIQDDDPGHAVFYNVYVNPDDDAMASIAHDIIREQLGQLSKSYAAYRGGLVLYYVSIGRPIPALWMQTLCQGYQLKCQHLHHYEVANEDRTLTELHTYCTQRPTQSVIYIHSKGTFHATSIPQFPGQDPWRRAGTAAATSKLCLDPPDDTCTTCGLIFQPLPGLHFPGNMFTAKCSYVSKLLSMSNFVPATQKIWDSPQQMQAAGSWQNEMFPWGPQFVGYDRFASEHWIGSHPDLAPCDVSPSITLDYWREEVIRDYDKEFSFSMAPRQPLGADWVWYGYCNDSFNSTMAKPNDVRFRQYFLLHGLIFRWLTMYGSIATRESWVWFWFPDGQRWLEAVERYGTRVLDEMFQ